MTGSADLGGGRRDRPGAVSVDRMRALGFVLGLIDRRVGGGRDDDVGPCRRDRRIDRFGSREVELRAAGGDDFDARMMPPRARRGFARPAPRVR